MVWFTHRVVCTLLVKHMTTDNIRDTDRLDLDNNVSLTDLIEGSGLDAADDINEPILFQNSPFFNNSEFINFLSTKNNSFIILSLNAQSLNAKYDTIKTYIDMYNECDTKISAICLQETWLTTDSDTSLLQMAGYNLVHRGKSCSAHGGVAIYLDNNLQYEVINISENSEIWDGIFVKVFVNGNKTVILGNIYRPPRQSVANITTFINDISDIINSLQNYKDIIISGDFNLDLLKFKENKHINDFLESMISSGYLPKITVPTRLNARNGTLIDNFFAKLTTQSLSTKCGVLTCQISDHLPYFLALDCLQLPQHHKYIRVVSSDIDAYQHFQNELNENIQLQNLTKSTMGNPNIDYEQFNEIMQTLINKYFPTKLVRYNKYKHKKSPWVTAGILKSIRYKDNLYIKLKSTPHNSHLYEQRLTNFKTYCKILKKMINTAKKLHYEKTFNKFKFDMKKTWSTINDILNNKRKRNVVSTKFDIDGLLVTDENIIADKFNTYFTDVGKKLAQNINTPNGITFEKYLNSPEHCNTFSFTTVVKQEVIDVINSLKPKTSCNLDRISSKLLKVIKNEIAEPLSAIFNKSVSQGVFPDLLKKAKIIPIYKDKEETLFSNYRPISILSSVSKVFERLMYNQLFRYFCNLKMFYKSQYGFRKHHSTEYAVLELIDRVSYAMDQNLLPVNIYLDLSKAFDTLDHNILLHKLNYYGVKGNSLSLLKSYLTNRTQQLQYNDTISDPSLIQCGVPQGSILGPLMFIVYINDIKNASNYFYPILYADDTTLCATLNSNYHISDTDKLNQELCNISNWLKANKLSLNVTKTKAMIFHTAQRQPNNPELYMDGIKIDFVDNFNFLGILIQKNLRWNLHIDRISKKITKTIGMMNKLKKYLPVNVLLNIYNTLILPHFNYGIIIWGHTSSKLFKFQKKAVRFITKSKYNAHTSPLFKKLGLLKLEDLCALHDLKFCFKFGNDLLPDYFSSQLFFRFSRAHNRITRQSYLLPLPVVSHGFAKFSISYKFPSCFNNIENCIKEKIDTHSFSAFKTYVKNRFIERYNINCHLTNCYICNL